MNEDAMTIATKTVNNLARKLATSEAVNAELMAHLEVLKESHDALFSELESLKAKMKIDDNT